MGGALLRGWLDRELADQYFVIEPNAGSDPFVGRRGVTVVASPDALPASLTPDVIVLAVKPQVMGDILAPYRRFAGRLILSIAAGKTLGFFARLLDPAAPVVRAMPNTPAAIGRGITVAVPSYNVSAAQRATADALLRATGSVAWVEDEGLMDAVTAVSGSGPAYIFLLAEELARAGVAAGLPEELATRLARETVTGSGELLHRSDLSAATLRQNVTSPGGTTAAALSVLMAEDGLQQLMIRAIAAATARSKELAK